MEEMIEKLKKNTTAWMFLSKEERDCLKQANKKAGVDNLKYDGEWDNFGKPWGNSVFEGKNAIWRINPNYKPEPVYEDIEITQQGAWLGIVRPWAGDYSRFPFDFTHLHCLPSLPNFDCFWHDNKGAQWNIAVIHVASKISEGKTVYARFRSRN